MGVYELDVSYSDSSADRSYDEPPDRNSVSFLSLLAPVLLLPVLLLSILLPRPVLLPLGGLSALLLLLLSVLHPLLWGAEGVGDLDVPLVQSYLLPFEVGLLIQHPATQKESQRDRERET